MNNKNLEKNYDILEFARAKLNLNLAFFWLINSYRLKIRIYIAYIWKTKFTQYLGETERHVYAKMQQVCDKNKLKLGERKL